MEWGWTHRMFLYLMVPGTCFLVTVHQPPVVTAALGRDVIMPCHLSNDEKMVNSPSLYWVHVGEKGKPWPTSEEYKERVDRLDKNGSSANMSILFKNVQWADSGKYLCKLSVLTTESAKRYRTKGNETLLMIYDNMIFNLTGHNNSLLVCQVNVTQDPRLVLSIFHDGNKTSVDSAPGAPVAALSNVTLTETISLRGGGKYECELHLGEHLITKSVFHYNPPVAGGRGDADKNVSSISEPGVVVFPEPWLLYVALLLVPITILLGLVTVLLMCRS